MNLKPLALFSCSLPLALLAGCHAEPTPPAALPGFIHPIGNNTNPPMVAKNATGTLGKVERLDPALDLLLAPDATVEILAEGIQWAEGPVWYRGGLLFSDVPQNVIYRWTAQNGVTPYLTPSGYTGQTPRGGEPGSNGLTLNARGLLTMCQHGERRVAQLDSHGQSVISLADHYNGKRFNSPNDLCFDARGNLYFTDPPYGLEGKDKDAKKEMDANGVYVRRTTGVVERLHTGDITYADGRTAPLQFPNGLAFSPDEKSLYVCVSDPANPVILKYDVTPTGNIANGKVFFDAKDLATKKLPGLPDGMKVDVHGNLWATGPGGVLILTPQAKHLGTIATGIPTANCAWGDDGSTLYLTANHNLCRIQTKTKGIMPGH